MNNLPNLKKLQNQDFWTQGGSSDDPFNRKYYEKQNNKTIEEILFGLDADAIALLEKKNGLV